MINASMSHLFNQLPEIFHYLFALFLLLIFIPKIFFKKQYNKPGEQIITNFVKMTFLLLVMGYLLVMLRLFEFLSIVFMLTFIGKHLAGIYLKGGSIGQQISHSEVLIYDYFEGKYQLKPLFFFYLNQCYRQCKTIFQEYSSTPLRTIETVSLLVILGFSLYLRFNDALLHSAPSFLDLYTALKWIKDIRQNLLFSDGIIPQGFHVFWAVMEEFSRIDTLYIVKYSGPFMQVFLMFGIYLVLSLLTGSRISGVISMSSYALLGQYFDPYYWDWQAVAAPGSFAHIFLLLTFFCLVVYLRSGHQDAFYTMFAGMGIIAFVHPASYCEFFIFICAVSIWAVVFKVKKRYSSLPRVFLFGLIAGTVSLIPVLVEFIGRQDVAFSFLNYLQIEAEKSFSLLPFPSHVPLIFSLAVGFLWHVLFKRFRTYRYQPLIERLLLISALISAFSLTVRQPVEPLKVDWDSSVAQYLAVTKEISPLNWMIVSKQEFSSLVQGRGYHMNIEELIKNYDPAYQSLTRIGFDKPDMNIPPHIFIIYEKFLRPVPREEVMKRLTNNYYKRWSLLYQEIGLWLKNFLHIHPQVEVYFEDEHIIIFHLEREQDPDEI